MHIKCPRLKESLDSRLVDDFVVALEQLNSPELAWKDLLETELQPLMEQTVARRSGEQVKRIWRRIYAQLLDCRASQSSTSSQSSSLYGTQSTLSLQAGDRIKKFATVRHIFSVQNIVRVKLRLPKIVRGHIFYPAKMLMIYSEF